MFIVLQTSARVICAWWKNKTYQTLAKAPILLRSRSTNPFICFHFIHNNNNMYNNTPQHGYIYVDFLVTIFLICAVEFNVRACVCVCVCVHIYIKLSNLAEENYTILLYCMCEPLYYSVRCECVWVTTTVRYRAIALWFLLKNCVIGSTRQAPHTHNTHICVFVLNTHSAHSAGWVTVK